MQALSSCMCVAIPPGVSAVYLKVLLRHVALTSNTQSPIDQHAHSKPAGLLPVQFCCLSNDYASYDMWLIAMRSTMPLHALLQVGMPADQAQYIHRVGRTARAGKQGQAILLLHDFEQFFLRTIQELPVNRLKPTSVEVGPTDCLCCAH